MWSSEDIVFRRRIEPSGCHTADVYHFFFFFFLLFFTTVVASSVFAFGRIWLVFAYYVDTGFG